MDFEDIDIEVPCFEYQLMFGQRDYSARQKHQPNMYKSHMRYDLVPKAQSKHIIIVRYVTSTTLKVLFPFPQQATFVVL